MNNGETRFESYRERHDPLTNEEEVPMQPPQPQIDFAVMEQISEFRRRTKTPAPDLINHVLRVCLDAEGAARLVSLGLDPLTPRFDGPAGYGCSVPSPSYLL